MEPFLNIAGRCNFTEAKIGEVCTGQGTISQKLNNTCKKKKTLHLAPEYIKKCPSGVSFIAFGS